MGLIFVDGVCVKEIGGAAINDVPDSIEAERPFDLAGVDMGLLVLNGDVVEMRTRTPEEIASWEDAELDRKVQRLLVTVLHNHENRIRVLEGKPEIALAQFRNALKTLLGL